MNLSLFSSSNCVVKHIICSTLATTHNRAQPIPYMYSKSPTNWEAWVFSFLPYKYSISPTNWEAPTSPTILKINCVRACVSPSVTEYDHSGVLDQMNTVSYSEHKCHTCILEYSVRDVGKICIYVVASVRASVTE